MMTSNSEITEFDKVLTMYHGTTIENAITIRSLGFQASDGDGNMLGPGIYLSRDLRKVRMYPRDVEECRKAILKVEVNIGKWIRVDQQGRSFATNWHEKGYDSFWVPSNCGLEEWCIYDPKRIKVIDIIEPKYLSISNDDKDDQSSSKKPRREELRNSDVDSEESHSYLIAAIFVILIGICVKWCVKFFLY